MIVSDDGYIITNNHVVRDADELEVMFFNGNRYSAKVIGADPKSDIAVIKVDAKDLRPISFGDSDRLRVGEWVMAIGSPLSEDLASTVTAGIVSAKGRSNVRLTDYEDFIQTDAAINPGNSGVLWSISMANWWASTPPSCRRAAASRASASQCRSKWRAMSWTC